MAANRDVATETQGSKDPYIEMYALIKDWQRFIFKILILRWCIFINRMSFHSVGCVTKRMLVLPFATSVELLPQPTGGLRVYEI